MTVLYLEKISKKIKKGVDILVTVCYNIYRKEEMRLKITIKIKKKTLEEIKKAIKAVMRITEFIAALIAIIKSFKS